MDINPFTLKKIRDALWAVVVIIFATFLACVLFALKWLVKPFYFWKKTPWRITKNRNHGNKTENAPGL